jgi:hypothetical protein
VNWNGNDFDQDDHQSEFKDIGATKVEVPEAAKKKNCPDAWRNGALASGPARM